MSKQFEQIKEGMLQAISHAKGRPLPGTRVHHPKPVDVKALRVGIGMTQEQFAAKFGGVHGHVAALGEGGSVTARSRLGLAQRDQAQPQGRDQSARCLDQVPQ